MSDYLTSSTTAPADAALTALFQALVVGVTGLDPTLVRPRWQPQPPTAPLPAVDWCAIGITAYTPSDYPQIAYNLQTDTTATQYRYERIDVLATFYGPDSSNYASQLRDAVYSQPYQLELYNAGIKLRSADNITHLGEVLNAQFIQRSDLPLSYTRMVARTYAIPSVGTVTVTSVLDDGLSSSVTVVNPN